MKIYLQRRYAQTVKDCASSYKIDYVKEIIIFHWFKSYGNFGGWRDFALGWSFIGKGLRLQITFNTTLFLNNN